VARKVGADIPPIEWIYPSQKELDKFFAALGRALATFVQIEDALYTGFEIVVRPGNVWVAMCAFHAVQHTQTKLNMTDAAMRAYLTQYGPDRLDEWDKIKSDCEKKLRRRNELAHFQALAGSSTKAGKTKIVMRPQMLDPRYAIGIKKYVEHPISSIEEIGRRFVALRERMQVFYASLPEGKWTFQRVQNEKWKARN
jgi:hypothetical protein